MKRFDEQPQDAEKLKKIKEDLLSKLNLISIDELLENIMKKKFSKLQPNIIDEIKKHLR